MVDTDKICANCQHYGFKANNEPRDELGDVFRTWAYCFYFQTWFPNARGWLPSIAELINERRKAEGLAPAKFKKPGERTCSNFKY